jgi:hypothetical protein
MGASLSHNQSNSSILSSARRHFYSPADYYDDDDNKYSKHYHHSVNNNNSSQSTSRSSSSHLNISHDTYGSSGSFVVDEQYDRRRSQHIVYAPMGMEHVDVLGQRQRSTMSLASNNNNSTMAISDYQQYTSSQNKSKQRATNHKTHSMFINTFNWRRFTSNETAIQNNNNNNNNNTDVPVDNHHHHHFKNHTNTHTNVENEKKATAASRGTNAVPLPYANMSLPLDTNQNYKRLSTPIEQMNNLSINDRTTGEQVGVTRKQHKQDFMNNNFVSPPGPKAKTPVSPTHHAHPRTAQMSFAVRLLYK